MNQERDSLPVDPDTGEHLQFTHRVYVCMSALESGYVDVQARSEAEAAQIALNDRLAEVNWKWTSMDDESVEVFEIECLEEPEDAMLVDREYCGSGANLDVIFEPDPPAPGSEG